MGSTMVVPDAGKHIRSYSDLLADRASAARGEAPRPSLIDLALKKDPGERSRAEREAVDQHAGKPANTAI